MKAKKQKLKLAGEAPVLAYRVKVPLLKEKEYASQVDVISRRVSPNDNAVFLTFHVKPCAEAWPLERQTLRLFKCVKCGKLDEFLWAAGGLCMKCINPKMGVWMRLKAWWRAKFPRVTARPKRHTFDFRDVGTANLPPPRDESDGPMLIARFGKD